MKRRPVKRPIFVAIKPSGKITERERAALRKLAFRKCTANSTMTLTYRHDVYGELLWVFDVYTVEELSVANRLRHALRVFKAAIARYINMQLRVVVITLEDNLSLMDGADHFVDDFVSFPFGDGQSSLAIEGTEESHR